MGGPEDAVLTSGRGVSKQAQFADLPVPCLCCPGLRRTFERALGEEGEEAAGTICGPHRRGLALYRRSLPTPFLEDLVSSNLELDFVHE